jgi:DNA replication and repair protein RecF
MQLKLERITLFNFKNWEEQSQIISRPFVCLLGANGTGKTNFLDAIYYLCTTKSYFNNVDSLHIGHHHEQASITGEFVRNEVNEQIICILRRGQKKILKRNFKEYDRMADHIGLLPVVMITPYDIELVWEGSAHRRKFMDGALCQTDKAYLNNWSLYNQALLQRNSLLRLPGISANQIADQIEPWNRILASIGPLMHSTRLNWTNQIAIHTKTIYEMISGGSEIVDLVYESDLLNHPEPQTLWMEIDLDFQAGRTRKGIHRDELQFLLSGKPLKKFGSQGQQKSFLMSVKLAQLLYMQQQLNITPILLLDDIFDKIDEKRILRILQWLKAHFHGQVFITDTSDQRLPGLMSKIDVIPQIIETNCITNPDDPLAAEQFN